jgi:hypothetical protein
MQVTHGLYICPLEGDAGHKVYCLDSRTLKDALHVMADVGPFLRLLTRTSSITSDLFDPPDLGSQITRAIGSPIFGDAIGLALLTWMAERVPPLHCAEMDVPDLVYVDSDEEASAEPPEVVCPTPNAFALATGPLLLRGTSVPIASASGEFLIVDSGAQIELHSPASPSVSAAIIGCVE